MTSTDLRADPAPEHAPARRLRPLLWLLAAQVAGGVALGLVWLAWSPHTVAYLIPLGNHGAVLIPAESESQIAGDGRFALLSAVLGVLAGVIAWRLRSVRGPLVPVSLVAGGVLGSVVARAVGQWLSGGSVHGAPNTAVSPPLTLHSLPLLALQAFFAVLVYTTVSGLSTDPHLGRAPAGPGAADDAPDGSARTEAGREHSGTGRDGPQLA